MILGSLVSCVDGENSGEGSGAENGEGTGGGEANLPDYGTEIGSRCYPTELALVFSDATVNIEDYEDKIVVLNFWGTWCNPCKAELPEFDNVASEYDGEVVIIAIHSTEGIENAPDYISENFADSKIIFAKDSLLIEGNPYLGDSYYRLVGASGSYPFTLVLDKNGVISYRVSGRISEQTLKGEIEKLR